MTATIPKRFSARFADNGNYALSEAYVPQIHLLIDFQGRINTNRLRRALRLTLDAEPILGCRYVLRWIRPYWQRISDDDLITSMSLREDAGDVLNLQNILDRFLAEPVNALQGPQVKALLLRGKENDRLVVKLNHQVVDAGGTKDFGYLLASFYKKLGGNSDFKPSPNLSSRSLQQVYGRFSKLRLLRILCRFFLELKNNMIPYKSIIYPLGNDVIGNYCFVLKRFSEQRVRSLKSYCIQNKATLNDLMVTALLRAYVRQCRWNGNGALRMVGTVDLRRYLPNRRAKSLCNLSSFYFLNLGKNLGAEFSETLSNVKARIDALKSDNFGLSFALGNYLFLLPYPFALKRFLMKNFYLNLAKTGNIPPSMTNLGYLEDQALNFGSPRVAAAEILVPPCYPPLFVSGLSGFRNTLTLSVGFFESAVPKNKVEELFKFVEEELIG